MKAPRTCEWTWMAEAGDDDRLSEDQRASFARHRDSCSLCTQEAGRVEHLRDLVATVPEPAFSDVHHHRQRQLLLARAGGERTTVLRSTFLRPRILGLATLSLVLAGLGLWRMGLRGTSAAAEAPLYEVTQLKGASWKTVESGGTACVTLSTGSAAFHVEKLERGQKFLVTLPDGEIEVRGTRFIVDVRGGRTRYVVVMEGKVALRQRGGQGQLLLAGQRWDAPSGAPVVGTAAEAPPASSASPSSLLEPIAVVPARHGPPRHATEHDRRRVSNAAGSGHSPNARPPVLAVAPPAPPAVAAVSAAVPSVTRSVPSPEKAPNLFARGVQAFRAGRYAEADELWTTFVANYPQDPRAEDVAFLRAVGRARQGDLRGGAALARVYLDHFPRGLRRKEAEALIHHADRQPTETR